MWYDNYLLLKQNVQREKIFDYVTSIEMDKYITFQHVFDKVDKDKKLKRAKMTVDYKRLPHDHVKS